MNNQPNMTPSLRDLAQFISPNPKAQEKALFFTESSGDDLAKHKEQFQNWEDNHCAIIIDTTACYDFKNIEYLNELAEFFSGPVLRYHDFREQDEIFDSRIVGFHGVVVDMQHAKAKEIFDWNESAKSVHFRLIPHVKEHGDWQKAVPLQSRFIYLSEGFGESLPPAVDPKNHWFIGEENVANKAPLKIIVNQNHQ
ncbi:MAG: hypothetical protein H7A33_03235 [Deltaproteobacteria bacterium]|nr:hypothetical protein [Deltaproteobacteria bacterium]